MPRKILFVSHSASKTGAPIVLLTFLTWLKLNSDIEIFILLKTEGLLLERFKGIARIFIWKPGIKKPVGRIKTKFLKAFKKDIYIPFPSGLMSEKFDLIYLNTADSLDLAPILKERFKCPIVAHIHENDFTVQYYYPTSLSEYNKQAINYYITVSEDNKNSLIRNHNINESKVVLFHEFIDVSKIIRPSKQLAKVKEELQIKDSFIAGGSGLSSWRKGVDLFINVAAYIRRNYGDSDIKFVWVGQLDAEFQMQLKYELSRLNIENEIIFTNEISDPNNYFQVFDLFLLTSREDPFPLVCLEAAALGKPVICFDNAGGMPEFVQLGGGVTVPYGNVEMLATTIIDLKKNDTQRKKLGAMAKQTIINYDVNVIAPKIFEFMQSCF